MTLKDDGGTENRGLDSSAAQTFVIAVIKSESPWIASIGWWEDGRLTMRWEGGHRLQWVQDPADHWDELPEAQSPFDIVPESDRRFNRLEQTR